MNNEKRHPGDDQNTIDLLDILYSVIKGRKLILGLAFLGLAIGLLLKGISYIQKQNVITASVSVVASQTDGTFYNGGTAPDPDEVRISPDIAESAIYVMESEDVISQVIDKLGLVNVDPQEVQKCLTVKQYGQTPILEATLNWDNGPEGVDILNEIIRRASKTLNDSMKVGDISVIDDARITSSQGSFRAQSVVLMTLLGALLGVMIIIFRVLTDPKVVNPTDVQEYLHEELLGEVPCAKMQPDMYSRLILDDQNFFDAEFQQSMSFLAHLIAYKLKAEGRKCFFVTSSFEEEGKTTVAANLAIQLSYFNPRVLLVDMCLSSPEAGRLFMKEVHHRNTLNAVYANEVTVRDAVIPLTSYLDLLPCRVEDAPLKLNDYIFHKIREVEDLYDYIVIDASPVNMVSDVLSLSGLTDQAVYVIRQNATNRKNIETNLRNLERVGIHILGCIVNRTDKKSPLYNQLYGRALQPAFSVSESESVYREKMASVEKKKKTFWHKDNSQQDNGEK
ncbi:AAA family ATPase [Porcincola sp. LCP21S3_C12]|uniref:AAA family ATPase n=1 Tax=Porcincola sp. LCP21S3_C12 TaxID=3438798 RepID=UPI003F952873